MGNRCTCFREESQNVVTFETEQRPKSRLSSEFASNEFANTNYTKAASQKSAWSKFSTEKPKDKNFTSDLIKEKSDETISKLKKLQAMGRGFVARQVFFRNKAKLIGLVEEMLLEYQKSFTVTKYFDKIYGRNGVNKFCLKNDKTNNSITTCERLFETRLLVAKDGSCYTGQVNLDNLKCGKGRLITKDGTLMEGFWANDKFTGDGVIIENDETYSEGNFVNFQLEGKGQRIYTNEDKYLGEFKNGLRVGHGYFICKEYEYTGIFTNDQKNGAGKMTYLNTKDVYEGNFKNGVVNGEGKYTWSNGEIYQGTFLNGKMHGRGSYKWPDGSSYVGDYVDNIKEGKGLFNWPNDRTFEGPFKDGKPHGIGDLTIKNKTVLSEFIEGKVNKEFNKTVKSKKSRTTLVFV